MPTVWELRCPKRIRSRRALFQEGVEALRRDAGVRRVTCSKTFALLQARVIFWNDGPADAGLARLREEFGPQRFGDLPQVALDFETSMVSAAQQAGRSIARVNFSIQEQVVMRDIASIERRTRLAAAMVAPLRIQRDYASLGRRALLVEQLPEGAIPLYNRDVIVPTGTIYVAGEPEFMGQMPVRTELTVLGPDDPNQPTLGGPISIEPLQMPFSRVLVMDYQYGTGSSITIPRTPVSVPEWCVVGTWAYDRSTGRFALVRRILDGNRTGVSFWFKGHLSRKGKVLPGWELHNHWNPCAGPKFPRESWWEDLLQDDFEGLV